MEKDLIVDVSLSLESPNVDVSLDLESPNVDLKVANKAGGIDVVKHDDTLVGNGDNEPLGVNVEVIATKEDVDKAVKNIDLTEYYTKEEVDEIVENIDVLPEQTGNAGKFLRTDGENLSWEKALTNNATDANSVFIGNDKAQYVEGGDGNVLLGAATKVADNSINNTVVGIAAQAFGQDGVAVGRAAYTKSQWATAVGYGAGAEESGGVAVGSTAKANSENSVAIGRGSNSSGSYGIAIGKDANVTVNGSTAIAIGASSSATGINSIALGTNTRVNSNSEAAVALGANAIVNKNGNTAVGSKANVLDTYGTAVGYQSQAKGTASIAIGMNAKTTITGDNGYNQIAIGKDASTQGKNAIAIGSEAQITDEEGIAVGHVAKSARHGIALGTRANANDFGTIAIGLNSESTTTNAVSIGNQSYARGQDSVALGSSAKVDKGAGFAVQLGVGTNSDANTLQFKDFKLLYENGLIPYERLSETTPSNGQVLTYDENEDALFWSEPTGGISEVKWGDVKGNINNQTDLNNKFKNIDNSIQSLDLDMSTNYQNLNKKFDNAIQNLEQDFSTSTQRLELEIQDTEDKLQSQIDTLSAIGEFLAIWDCDTGSARYLNEGYEYKTGNYFIIGTIAEGEGVVNYMPDGSSYPGKAETTEDVRVSDMCFYDGEHWIYLANHERAIAVDAELNSESSNPVENKAITKHLGDFELLLDNRFDDIRNSIDETNSYVEELQNRPVPIAVPQLASVDVEQVKDQMRKEERRPKEEWMGQYSEIIVTTNLDKETLINNMYDLYITISRFKTNKNLSYMTYNENGDEFEIKYRNVPKYSVMNDLRQKTNMRLYCWRFVCDSSLTEDNPARYCYFYTRDLYLSEQYVLDYAHEIGLWSNCTASTVSYGTCFNAIGWTNGYSARDFYHDYRDGDVVLERYEEGDISEFANVSNSANYPEYNISDYVTKMECRKYTRDGQNYFLWCADWEDESSEIYNLTDDNDNPMPNGIPDHMDKLNYVWNVFDLPSEYVFVEKRPDLNYKKVNNPDMLLEALQELTFRGKFIDDEGRPTYWNCYWFDYPVMPIMLKDCEVRKHESDATNRWIKLEDLVRNGDTDKLRDDLPLELRLPYNTYYLWMRFCSLQKRCAYGDYSNWLGEEGRGIDIPMYPHQKNDLLSGVRDYNILSRRAFARPRQAYRNNSGFGKISEHIQFNICYPITVSSGVKSKSTPITKKLNITANAISGLRD